MKTILLLGGTGTIGKATIELLKKDNNWLIDVTTRQAINSEDNVTFIQGDAHENSFLEKLFKRKHYSAVIDFMSYKTQEFKDRIDILLDNTDQYFFISSARVYADNGLNPITEDTLRLLEQSNDCEYLKTDEYALTKARQEDLLFNSIRKNWTIIRPYITFGADRLQLGIYEKEQWLFRAINNKKIVFPNELKDNYTTLTPNGDVAKFIWKALDMPTTKGQVYHVTGEFCLRWDEIIEIYASAISKYLGIKPKIVYTDRPIIQPGSEYQYKYDRCFNRIFDNSKSSLVSKIKKNEVRNTLDRCIKDFLQNPKFKSISWRLEGQFDRKSHDFALLPPPYNTLKNSMLYVIYRCFPFNI